jgi:tRNA pseudouridine13 synthase
MLDLVTQALAPLGWQLRELRVKYPRDSFFSKGERAALVWPAKLQHQLAGDELYPGREKLTLAFELPRGSYATLVCKRILGQGSAVAEENLDSFEDDSG